MLSGKPDAAESRPHFDGESGREVAVPRLGALFPCNRRFETSGSRNRVIRGFTLLEVMIALLVLAIGVGAVINTIGESGWKSAQLRQKTIAGWVAQNRIAEFRARRTWSNKSNYSGTDDMANAEWDWKMKISKTDDPSLRRIDVDVYLKGDDGVKASATGFVAKL